MFNNQTMRAISMASLVGVLSLSATNLSGVTAAPTKPSADSKSYVTAIFKNSNKNDESQNHIAGVELDLYDNVNQFNRMESANAYWVRSNAWAINWRQLESNGPGEYNPSDPNYGGQHMREYEYLMATAYDRGFKVIQIIRGAPSWASPAGKDGCAIRPEHYDNFANFVGKIVQKYSKPPYNIQYWEIWNEPDVASEAVANIPDSPFGCWGNPKDEYFGGGAYGETLKVVYPLIKSADPKAQVIIGGLLLDCDPRVAKPDKDCKPSKFLEGILKNGGGSFFDGISFHAYDFFYGKPGQYGNGNWDSVWNVTGPVLAAKTRFIKEVLAQHNVKGKYLINTETGVLCYQCQTVPVEFEITKAYYVPVTYATAAAEGLSGNIWYSLSGWQESGLLNKNQTTLAYKAYQVWSQQIKDMQFVAENTAVLGVKIYEFKRGDKRVWVAWSNDGSLRPINVAVPVKSIVDALGNPKPLPLTQIDIIPLYIELEK